MTLPSHRAVSMMAMAGIFVPPCGFYDGCGWNFPSHRAVSMMAVVLVVKVFVYIPSRGRPLSFSFFCPVSSSSPFSYHFFLLFLSFLFLFCFLLLFLFLLFLFLFLCLPISGVSSLFGQRPQRADVL